MGKTKKTDIKQIPEPLEEKLDKLIDHKKSENDALRKDT